MKIIDRCKKSPTFCKNPKYYGVRCLKGRKITQKEVAGNGFIHATKYDKFISNGTIQQ